MLHELREWCISITPSFFRRQVGYIICVFESLSFFYSGMVEGHFLLGYDVVLVASTFPIL